MQFGDGARLLRTPRSRFWFRWSGPYGRVKIRPSPARETPDNAVRQRQPLTPFEQVIRGRWRTSPGWGQVLTNLRRLTGRAARPAGTGSRGVTGPSDDTGPASLPPGAEAGPSPPPSQRARRFHGQPQLAGRGAGVVRPLEHGDDLRAGPQPPPVGGEPLGRGRRPGLLQGAGRGTRAAEDRPPAGRYLRRIVTDAFSAWAAGTAYVTGILAPDMRWEIVGRSARFMTLRDGKVVAGTAFHDSIAVDGLREAVAPAR